MSKTTLGNITTNYTYSTFGEMDSFTVKNTDTEYFKTLYTRNKLGRITQKTETIEGTTNTYVYKYDVAGRLDAVYKDTEKISDYKYDSNGNRLTSNDSPLALLSSYDDQDRLLYEPVSDTTYAYNAHGDLETKTDSKGTTSYNYDEMGNLLSAILPSGSVIDYVIDGRNRRVGKKVDGVVTNKWIYADQLNPIAEIDADGVETVFVYGTKINIPDYMIRNGHKYSIISDHLGSMRMIVDEAGTVVFKRSYSEFGKITDEDSVTDFEAPAFGFAGGIYDVHTGLVRFGTRDLDPTTGRWTNKDYIGFGGGTGNLYEYVNNDPVNYVDPEGKSWLPVIGGLVGGMVNSIHYAYTRRNAGEKVTAKGGAASFLIGAVTGAIMIANPYAAIIVGAQISLYKIFLEDPFLDWIDKDEPDIKDSWDKLCSGNGMADEYTGRTENGGPIIMGTPSNPPAKK